RRARSAGVARSPLAAGRFRGAEAQPASSDAPTRKTHGLQRREPLIMTQQREKRSLGQSCALRKLMPFNPRNPTFTSARCASCGDGREFFCGVCVFCFWFCDFFSVTPYNSPRSVPLFFQRLLNVPSTPG